MTCNFYQIAYSDETLKPCNPSFKIFNQLHSPNFDRRETWHMINFFENVYVKDDGQFYALVSPKFIDKLKINFLDLKRFVEENRDKDLLIFNTDPKWTYFFFNSWEQGESFHKGLKQTANYLNEGKNDFINFNIRHNKKVISYSNYWAGKYSFWKKFVEELKVANEKTKLLPDEKKNKFYATAQNHTAPMYTFVFERLLTNFILKENDLNFGFYKYNFHQIIRSATNLTDKTILFKYMKIIDHLDSIEDFASIDLLIRNIMEKRTKAKKQNLITNFLSNVSLLFK